MPLTCHIQCVAAVGGCVSGITRREAAKQVICGSVLTVACGWRFKDPKISSDDGLLLFRERDDVLGPGDLAGSALHYP